MKNKKTVLLLMILLVSVLFLAVRQRAEADTSSAGSTYETPAASTATTKPALARITITISGSVYDVNTRNPISGARVNITGDNISKGGFTDIRGRYSIAGCPGNERLMISCRKTGYAPYRATLPKSSKSINRNIPLTTLAGTDFEKEYPETPFVAPEEAPDPDKEYAPGIDPEKFEERKPEVERLEQAVLAGPGIDLEVVRFIIKRLDVTSNPTLFSLEPENEEYKVTIVIKNNGSGRAEGVPVALRIDGEDRENWWIPAIDEEDTKPAAQLIGLEEGRHEFEAIVQYPGDIDESNDTMRGIVTVVEGPKPTADLELLTFTIDGSDVRDEPALPQGNGRHIVSATYRNKGPADLENINLRMAVDGDIVLEGEVDPLDAGEGDDFERRLIFGIGAHEVILIIFARMDYEDLDNNNNAITGSVTFEMGVAPPLEEAPPDGEEDLDQEVPDIDLHVRAFSIDGQDVAGNPILPHGNGEHRIALHVTNNGPDDARDVQVILWRRDDDNIRFEPRNIGAGRAFPFDELGVNFAAGRHDLSVTAHSLRRHNEENMDNNRIRGIVAFAEQEAGDDVQPGEDDGEPGPDDGDDEPGPDDGDGEPGPDDGDDEPGPDDGQPRVDGGQPDVDDVRPGRVEADGQPPGAPLGLPPADEAQLLPAERQAGAQLPARQALWPAKIKDTLERILRKDKKPPEVLTEEPLLPSLWFFLLLIALIAITIWLIITKRRKKK